MPMIEVTTSELVDQRKAKILKAGLGENISLFPGKEESRVMVAIKDQAYVFFAGEEGPAALVSVALYQEQPEESYAAYSKAAAETVRRALPQIPYGRIYVKYQTLTHKSWGREFEPQKS